MPSASSHGFGGGRVPSASSHGFEGGRVPSASSHGFGGGRVPSASSHGFGGGRVPSASSHGFGGGRVPSASKRGFATGRALSVVSHGFRTVRTLSTTSQGFDGGCPPSAVKHDIELDFAPSAFVTWGQSAAPTNKNANESKTASLIERMNPPQNLWGLETRTRDAGILTSECKGMWKRKK